MNTSLVDIVDETSVSYVEYALSVITSRALPNIKDGLKPVQRRIIYTMKEASLYPNSPFVKSISVVGDTLKKYHPHGDAAVYGTLTKMAQPFNFRYPLVDGQGNFGSISGAPPAAARYTEARMSKYAANCVIDIDKGIVGFGDNFDGRYQEPEVLPVSFPNLLCNGSSGVAVGMATKIPSHNLSEVIDAAIAMIKNPAIDLDGIMKYVQGPDFASGGYILGVDKIKIAYNTGKGPIVLQAKVSMEDENGSKSIVVTELPYEVSPSQIELEVFKLKNKEEDGISEITDVKDLSDNDRGTHIVIELSSKANADVILEKLFNATSLRRTFNFNMRVISDGIPKLVGLKDIIREFIDFRTDTMTKLLNSKLNDLRSSLHIQEGFETVLKNVRKVVDLIEVSANKDDATKKLIAKYKLSDEQVEKILSMPLVKLTKMERQSIIDNIKLLNKEIKKYVDILSTQSNLDKYIISELSGVKAKLGDERRTQIIDEEPGKVDVGALIGSEEMVVIMTKGGYIKRTPLSEYHRTKNKGGKGVTALTTKAEDTVRFMFVAPLNGEVLFFTNSAKMYYQNVHRIPVANKGGKGVFINSLLTLDSNEKVEGFTVLGDSVDNEYLLFITKSGAINKVAIADYKIGKRKRGLLAFKLGDNDEICKILKAHDKGELMLITKKGIAVRYSVGILVAKAKSATGVKVIKLGKDDHVVDAQFIKKGKGLSLLTVSSMGRAKRTDLSEYRQLITRPSKGVVATKLSDDKDYVVAMEVITKDDDVMLITSGGKSLRYNCSKIKVHGRVSAGSKLITLADNEVVSDVVAILNSEEVK